MQGRIFLSHKGANKTTVRLYYRALKAAGFHPWLDELDMPAGTNPDRGIREGFKESGAVIFFLTPDFKDERFLRDEINYAKEEERVKGEEFTIISLIVPETSAIGHPQVPDLLHQYIWVREDSHLDSLSKILEAVSRRKSTHDVSIPCQLHHISLAVKNLKDSIEFYQDVLGLTLNPNRPEYLFPGAWFTLPNGQELHLVVNSRGTFRKNKVREQLYLDNHLALRVPSLAAFEKRMIELGRGDQIEKDETLPTRYPQRYMLDPDGHIIEVNAQGISEVEAGITQ